ncbi:SusC/RagA family TonB-linked outer membrane protein [Pedobacter sp. AW31-3R]|uniref:SusC/RagA family TonB-linked outer membrane protein n=1 Tax=Pedobacter sp. AW31-3R TaxID=3445781 RepID=UPI003F9F2778
MKVFVVIILATILQVKAGTTFAQKINLNEKDASLVSLIKKIRQQSGYDFIYNVDLIGNVRGLDVKISNGTIAQTLDLSLKNTNLTYTIADGVIYIKRSVPAVKTPPDALADSLVSGRVINAMTSTPIAGVSVAVKNRKRGVKTNEKGEFSIPVERGGTIMFSFVGFQSIEVLVSDFKRPLTISMEETVNEMKDVIVMGMFTRKASTYTGSTSSFKQEELLKAGNQNLIKSLANLDPSFNVQTNMQFGSDPNRIPDIQIRGQSGLPDLNGEYKSNPNLPLFILDGFETTIDKIIDLDMYRVRSVTILKDAASKAIYGSRAANGVVVIETLRPVAGKLRISYNANFNLETPDLSSYNMVNAREKLEVERAAGLYDSPNPLVQAGLISAYSENLKAVESGVNTDWLAQPVRNGFGQRHSLRLDGGEESFRYGIDLMQNNVAGVMKGSGRSTSSGAITMIYRVGKFAFNNILTVSGNKATNSPYGSFEQYTRINPYVTPFDQFGRVKKIANYYSAEPAIGDVLQSGQLRAIRSVFNPLWNGEIGTSDISRYTDITNNFNADWRILDELRLNARISFTRQITESDVFLPAEHTSFANYTDVTRKGSYAKGNGKVGNLLANISASYTKQLGLHYLTLNAGMDMNSYKTSSLLYTVEGFMNEQLNYPSLGLQFAEGSKLSGAEDITRDMGGFGSFNYSYDDRFLADFSYRLTASSQFGTNERLGSFWSAGLGWNLHNESFIKSLNYINELKVRASTGFTGSQNFNSFLSLTTFNYITDNNYINSNGAYVLALSNPDLRWQRRSDQNAGLDLRLFDNRFSLVFDYYLSNTDGLLTDVSLPPSSGFDTYKANLGKVRNTGFDTRVNYRVYNNTKNGNYVNVYATMGRNKSTLIEISSSLKALNDKQDEMEINSPGTRFVEGYSVNTIWAVRSLGIDPSNGKELYLTKDGEQTYVWDAADQIAAGDNLPKFIGNVGFDLRKGGWQFNASFAYRLGGQMYNQTLVDKVENANPAFNVDRRVLTGRWRQPGDLSFFKDIANTELTRPSTRFVENLNEIRLAAVGFSYELDRITAVKSIGIERLRVGVNSNEVFVASSMRTERGTIYPFARTISLTLQASF